VPHLKNKSPKRVAFYQALGQIAYILIVAFVFWRGDKWFGPVDNYLGPIVFLTLFVVSASISGLIVFGYPFYIFLEKKQTKEAIKIVVYTTAWLVLFLMFLLLFVVIR